MKRITLPNTKYTGYDVDYTTNLDQFQTLESNPNVGVNYIRFVGLKYDHRKVTLFNTNSSNWTSKEQVDSLASLGNTNAALLLKFLKIAKGMSIGAAYMLLTGSYKLSNLRQGKKFTITQTDYANGVKMYNALLDFRNDSDRNLWKTVPFVKAFYTLFTDEETTYRHSVMQRALGTGDTKWIKRETKMHDHLRSLKKLYALGEKANSFQLN